MAHGANISTSESNSPTHICNARLW